LDKGHREFLQIRKDRQQLCVQGLLLIMRNVNDFGRNSEKKGKYRMKPFFIRR